MLHATTVMSNPAHMRFVHSCYHLKLFFSGYALDRRCDFRSLIELGECGLPWTICSPMLPPPALVSMSQTLVTKPSGRHVRIRLDRSFQVEQHPGSSQSLSQRRPLDH